MRRVARELGLRHMVSKYLEQLDPVRKPSDFDNAAWPRFDIQFWPHPDVFLIAPRFAL